MGGKNVTTFVGRIGSTVIVGSSSRTHIAGSFVLTAIFGIVGKVRRGSPDCRQAIAVSSQPRLSTAHERHQ